MDPSRQRVFDLEYRYLDAVHAEARVARVDWLAKLTAELQLAIPKFVATLDIEDSKSAPDRDE